MKIIGEGEVTIFPSYIYITQFPIYRSTPYKQRKQLFKKFFIEF